MSRPIVVYRRHYLPSSETFIYEQITHIKQFRPYILCKKKLPEAKRFPYSRVYCLHTIKNKEKEIKRKGIQLIYARFGMGGVEMLPLKRVTHLPMLTSFHGSDLSRQLVKNRRYREMLPSLFSEGEAFTVVCMHMKQKLIELGCPNKKIHIIKSGIDLEKFPFMPVKSFEGSSPRLISIGRLTAKKGMDDLIRAFSLLLKEYPYAGLTIIGDGEEREQLLKQVERYQIKSQVKLMGYQEHISIQQELRKCDLFVLASRTAADGNEEGIPNVIMEAMASGVPVVSTKHAGIPELVEHGVTGYLAPEQAPSQLAQVIEYALRNSSEWEKIVQNAWERVEQEHDVKKQVQKLERLMRNMIFFHHRRNRR